MHAEEYAEYREAIADEIGDWTTDARCREDPWWQGIERIPRYLDALVALSHRFELDDLQRRIVHRVIKYLVSPLDLMPEFIFGPLGFREDLALIAMAVARFNESLGKDVLAECGFDADDPGLAIALARGESDLDDDVRYHLRLLLDADSVAGDEELARAEAAQESFDSASAATDPRGRTRTIVFAGPGTGKTHRLETELRRLLVEEAVSPREILVATFTNKAADELRLRIRQRLENEPIIDGLDRVLQYLTVSTIHSFCFRLIGAFHYHALFLKGTFSPIDETQRMLFLFRHGIGRLKLKEIYTDWKSERRQANGWRPVDLFHFYAYVGEIYDFLSEDVMKGNEPALRQRYLQLIQAQEGVGTVDERIIRTYPRYWRLVQEEGFLDHSMALAYAEALLDDPQVRRRVQSTYRHVLVDEYQDTNPIQDRIFRQIVGATGQLFAVGDDDQSIYAFRGADVRNATEFTARWPGANVEKLEENRRSTARIVEATTGLISHNRVRQPKKLFTHNPAGDFPWRVEAEEKALPGAVAQALVRLKANGTIDNWNDVALLFRGLTTRVAEYRQALHACDVPTELAGDRRFLLRPAVRALMKVFDLIQGDADKIGNRTRAHRPFFEALGWSDRQKMLDAVRQWHRNARDGKYDTLLELYYAILNDTDAIGAMPLLPDLGHLSGFIAAAEAQLTSPELLKRLGYFLRYADAASANFTGPAPPGRNAVQVMTIHKSKGLEFSVVVVADAVAGVIPAHFGDDTRTRLRRDMAGIQPHLEPIEEERRVLYVAMTRAEQGVMLATTPDKHTPYLAEFHSEPFPKEPPPAIKRFYTYTPRRAPPLHLSHGEIYNYDFCPRRYLLENRYGFAGQVIMPLRAGQSLHRALEIYHRLKRDGEHVSRDRRTQIFERAWIRPRDTKKAKAEFDKLFKVFDTYADGFEESGDGRVRVVETEQPFYFAQGLGVLTGKIDLVRKRNDVLEIVEFKFHANPMMPDYPHKQLDHYSLAYSRDRPRLVVHYLQENHEDVLPGREPEPIRAELNQTFSYISQEKFASDPVPKKCRLCPVRFACADRC